LLICVCLKNGEGGYHMSFVFDVIYEEVYRRENYPVHSPVLLVATSSGNEKS